MKSFTITNADNTKMTVDLIRYFKFKTDCFLIYSIGEIDDKNYKKLYLVRIMEELGFPVVQTIKNEADWANMQGIVKKVLKELKKNSKKITEDLDYREIEGIKIVEPRFFKLDSKLVDILASNYMEGETTNMSDKQMNINESIDNDSVENLDNNLVEIQNNEAVPPVEPLPVYSNDNPADQLISNVEVTNTQPDLQNENNSSNANNNIKNTNMDVTPLESIDQTIINQGEFKPIELDNVNTTVENNDLSMNQNTEYNDVQPIDNVVEQNVSSADIPKIDSAETTPIIEKTIEPIVPQMDVVSNIESNKTVVPEVSVVQESEPDYKELYEAVKADNEATNNLLNDVLVQLSAYKQKYGELE